MKVQCPSCKKICHETTASYTIDTPPNGSMVRLLDPWKTWGWGTFGNNCGATSATTASEMFCPSCDGLLAPGGRLTMIEEKKRIDATLAPGDEPISAFACSECGWSGKTAPALKRHMTMEHSDAT